MTTTAPAPSVTTRPTPGTWVIDAGHSHVGFVVRHLMVSKVRGEFSDFEGTITIGENLAASSVEATVQAASVNTRDEARDGHLRTSDFFAIDEHPTWTLRSTGLDVADLESGEATLQAELTIRGVTRAVELAIEWHGVHADPWGGTRLGLTASTRINRKDFGVNWNLPIDGGGLTVGEKVDIVLEVEAVLQAG